MPNDQNVASLAKTRKCKSALTDEITRIADALDALLTYLLAERERQRKANADKPIKLTVLSAADLAALPIQSYRETRQHRIIEDPLAGALELAIRELGEVLFEIGDTALMSDILERVAERHPRSYAHRAGILDHGWEAIGDAWWC